MSNCGPPSGGDHAHLFGYDDDEDPSEPEFFADGEDGDGIPPDPLLKSGTFILEPTTGPTLTADQPPPQQPAQNGAAADRADREPERFPSPPSKSAAERGTASPSSVAAAVAAETSAPSSGRKGQKPAQAGASGATPERPNWLPEGWRMECKVRTSGATAGSFDRIGLVMGLWPESLVSRITIVLSKFKYYIEPVSGRRFRSKVEVDYFLQTGNKPNKKAKPDADANRQEKSGSKKKKSAPLNFDFNNPPEKVRWVLTDAVKDQWTPFVGDKIIPKSTRQEWNAAFQFSSG
ncbi:hypothetical protein RHMOL_Rhmol13G0262300 [Rhododendron molle]|uniref:Uncharacterized protein n=1 Tax=Rhododendron molle TaxID=49168 RepID=A0ACC0LAN6_RHOML|nr:hypothetical protein RHMOL_Rhmol13G0262300 [Rhododendron molle]